MNNSCEQSKGCEMELVIGAVFNSVVVWPSDMLALLVCKEMFPPSALHI